MSILATWGKLLEGEGPGLLAHHVWSAAVEEVDEASSSIAWGGVI